MLYKTITGKFVKLLRTRPSGRNTFIEVDELGVPTKEVRKWQIGSNHLKVGDEQHYIISDPYGNKLIPITNK